MSADALNCGNRCSAVATIFSAIAVIVSFPPAFSACGVLDRQNDLADFDAFALLDADVLHRASDAGRHFDRGLVGFKLENGLVFLHRVSR